MTIQLRQGKRSQPRRVVLYGEHGVGKSTWAASAKGAVFIDVEGGLNDIDCHSFEQSRSLEDVREAFAQVDSVPGIRWLVIDSADWLEALIHQDICMASNSPSIAEACGGYGKGYVAASVKFEKFLTACEGLRSKGIGIIVLAHAKTAKVEQPGMPTYDQFQPALHDKASAMLLEWADEVLFATTKVFTKKEDAGFGRERNVAIGGTERVIKTTSCAMCVAKNRLGLPDELPMIWAEYAKYLTPWDVPKSAAKPVEKPTEKPSSNPLIAEMEESFGGDIAGIVRDGSSKAVTA